MATSLVAGTHAAATLLALASILSVACEGDFESRTKLSGYRVVGIEASPPEVAPNSTVNLLVHDFYDGSEPLSYAWSLCPYSVGSAVNYECIDSELEVPIGSEPEITLDFGPNGLDLEEKLTLFQGVVNPDGTERSLEAGFDIWLRLDSGPDCDGCKRIETVKRLRIRDNPREAANQNPVILGLDISGDAVAGESVSVRVDVEAPESFRDPDTGEIREEEYIYTWYTTAGETDPGLTFGAERETELELPDESGEIEVMVAVRDGRGGMAVESTSLVVAAR